MSKKIDILSIPAVYLNLDEDIDKNKNMLNLFSKIGIAEINRVSATRGYYEPGTVKYESQPYISAVANSYIDSFMNMTPPFIFLEDDVEVTDSFRSSIEVPNDADIVYLGGSIYALKLPDCVAGTRRKAFRKTNMSNILELDGMLSLHAIVVLNEQAKNLLINILKEKNLIFPDVRIARLQKDKMANFYAIDPPLFYQTDKIEATYDPYR